MAGNGRVPHVVSWLRSLPTAEAVGAIVGQRYGLTVRSCVLLRSLNNEVYQVAADDRRYAFKLYRHGGRFAGEVAWEQDLVAHVIGRGVPCAAPVPLPDGSPCGELDAPEGPRPFALSEWVEGTKPLPPASVQATGHWHAFADGYTAEHPLPDLSVIPWLEVCQLIGNLRFHLVEKPQYRGLESLAEGWADRALARADGCPRDCSRGWTVTRPKGATGQGAERRMPVGSPAVAVFHRRAGSPAEPTHDSWHR